MALSIRNKQVEAKARRYAGLRQTTVTAAIEEALDSKLAETDEARERRIREFKVLVRCVQAEIAKLPILDDRTPDEILGYDEPGLPP